MTKHNIDSTDLPALQPRTHCVLIPRDPNFIYAYWDYTEADMHQLRHQIVFENGESLLVLRVYDITRIHFNGSNANHIWDLEVGFSAKNLYIEVGQDNADYCVELGVRCGEDHFIPLMRSNLVHTPPKTASKRDDLIWQDIKFYKESRPYIKEDIKGRNHRQLKNKSSRSKPSQSARVYQLTAQNIRSYYTRMSQKGIPGGITWQKVRPFITSPNLINRMHPGASGGLIDRDISENQVSSHAGASESWITSQAGASEGRLNKRKFFFEVWTELIVHGRTEPDATVLLNQKGVKLNPDGTFSLRYALPDGEIPLKFIAQSSDGIEQRHIYTRVERERTISFPKMFKDPNG